MIIESSLNDVGLGWARRGFAPGGPNNHFRGVFDIAIGLMVGHNLQIVSYKSTEVGLNPHLEHLEEYWDKSKVSGDKT